MDVSVIMMFFLPKTIPRVPSVKITIADGDMPCTIPNSIFHVRPLMAMFGFLQNQNDSGTFSFNRPEVRFVYQSKEIM